LRLREKKNSRGHGIRKEMGYNSFEEIAGMATVLCKDCDHFIDYIQNGTKCIMGIEHAKKVADILEKSTNTT
jgi:hypothetical protein